MIAAMALAAQIAVARPATPHDAVAQFYTAYLADKPPGLPSGPQLERLRPFLSAKLVRQITDALAYEADYIKQHPDDKPPFVDGDYFSSLFEGPSSFRIGQTVPGARGTWKVTVHFRYENFSWKDTAIVTQEEGRYVIDDVLFSGAGEFNPPGRLSKTLKARE